MTFKLQTLLFKQKNVAYINYIFKVKCLKYGGYKFLSFFCLYTF